MPSSSKGPTYIQACARCNSKKIKCHVRAGDAKSRCEQCAASNVDCTPRVRKKRRTAATSRESRPTEDLDARSIRTPGTILDHATIETPSYQFPDIDTLATARSVPQDPGTGSSTFIGRSHYEGDAPVDEATARSYTQSRHPELSEIERKTLELWDVFALPPRPVLESLTEAFSEFCSPWMPVLEPADLNMRDSAGISFLLSQAVFLAASRVSSSSSVQAFSTSAQFYQRAKALYWVGHEKDPLTVIKAITMLHWYTPDGPAFVSYDTSEYWLKIGVGLAHQIGLHRDPSPGPKRAIRRRVWWTLVVRDALISVSRGRPRAIQAEDYDVAPPTLEDFPESPSAGELFISYVEICRTLGDLVQNCSRKQITTTRRSEVAATLFRWTRMLPLQLRLADYVLEAQSYQLRPHDFNARQLHVPYLACILILSRVDQTQKCLVPAAIFAASYLAGIYEDLLARNLVCRLPPIFTTFGLMAGLVLSSLRPHRALWNAAQADLGIIHTALQELSSRWRSAIGAAKVIQKAMNSGSPEVIQPVALPTLTRDDASLFEGLPLDLCRMWKAYEGERAAQSSVFDIAHLNLRQHDTMGEILVGLPNPQQQSQLHQLGSSLDLVPDPDHNILGIDALEGIPDYFWGDWGLA